MSSTVLVQDMLEMFLLVVFSHCEYWSLSLWTGGRKVAYDMPKIIQ